MSTTTMHVCYTIDRAEKAAPKLQNPQMERNCETSQSMPNRRQPVLRGTESKEAKAMHGRVTHAMQHTDTAHHTYVELANRIRLYTAAYKTTTGDSLWNEVLACPKLFVQV
jgi:hypothetical protein